MKSCILYSLNQCFTGSQCGQFECAGSPLSLSIKQIEEQFLFEIELFCNFINV